MDYTESGDTEVIKNDNYFGYSSRIDEETAGYVSSNFGDDSENDDAEDSIFGKIRASIESGAPEDRLVQDNGSVASLDRLSIDSLSPGATHSSLVYGFIPKGCYNHPIKSGALLGICHNPRYRQFLVLDAKGITSWKYDAKTGPPVVRQLNYPSYQYRLYTNLVYDRKHNVYFCLGKDFSLKILNHHFQETYTVEANLRNVMFLLYNPKREELITGGVGGSKVWQFVQVVEDKGWTEVKAMSNYKLQHKYTLRNVGGGWVKKVAMDDNLGHLYCCSETDLHAYNLNNGDEIFSLTRAHDMSITGCVYSTSAQFIITSSNDCTVKCWIVNGGLVHTFRVHTKAVTQIMSHPHCPSLVLTCSADCSIKLLSLDTLGVIFSITVSTEGVQWMGLTHENLLWACTSRQVTMWNLNHFVHFFSLSRISISKMGLQSAPKKTTRLLTVGDDSCVRLFSTHQKKNLCSVLPMPCLSALETVKCVSYSRELNLVYCLLNQSKLWIYTTRTDPACRIAQWDFKVIQDMLINKEEGDSSEGSRRESLLRKTSPHRAVGDIHVNVEVCDCTTIATLNSNLLLWGDEGWVGTVPTKFLMIGLTDGRVLFMDPFVRGLLHVDFRANKDMIREIRHDKESHQLLIQCDRNEVAVVQIWGLPTLQLQHELCLYQDIVASTRLGDTVFYGYSDGTVSFHDLVDVDDDNINRRTNQIKNTEELRLSNLVQKKVEHRAAIISVDCCPRKRLFLSCSMDSLIKIWSVRDQCVIADITLDSTLSCASFLNSSADIVFGFLNNIYYVTFNSLCPDFEESNYRDGGYAESITAESEIYEDPSTTNEGIIPNQEPLSLTNYLKPYELDITKDFLEATDIVVRPQTREKEEEQSEIMSNAPTDIYISECSTPRLSRMDVFTPQPIQWDEMSTHSGRASSRARSADSDKSEQLKRQQKFDLLDVTNPEHAEHFLPLFGDSPGGTPSVSSVESLTDSRSDLDDISDFEFGTEYGSDENELKVVKKKQQTKASKPAKSHQTPKKKKSKKSELVLTLAPDDMTVPALDAISPAMPKYGIDKMKVDVGALLKQGKKKKKVSMSVEPSVVVEKESMADQLANLALRQSLQAGASELSSKKKKAAGSRKRAPAKKLSVGSVKRVEKEADHVIEPIKPFPVSDQQPMKKEKMILKVSAKLGSHIKYSPFISSPIPPASNTHSMTAKRKKLVKKLASQLVKRKVKRIRRVAKEEVISEEEVLQNVENVEENSQATLHASGSMSIMSHSKTSDATTSTKSNLESTLGTSSSLPHTAYSTPPKITVGSFSSTQLDNSRTSFDLSLSKSAISSDYLIRRHSSTEPERILSADKHKTKEQSVRAGISNWRIQKVLHDAHGIKLERTSEKRKGINQHLREVRSNVSISSKINNNVIHQCKSDVPKATRYLSLFKEEDSSAISILKQSNDSLTPPFQMNDLSESKTSVITHSNSSAIEASFGNERSGSLMSIMPSIGEQCNNDPVTESYFIDQHDANSILERPSSAKQSGSFLPLKPSFAGQSTISSAANSVYFISRSKTLVKNLYIRYKKQKEKKLASLNVTPEPSMEDRLVIKRENALSKVRQRRKSFTSKSNFITTTKDDRTLSEKDNYQEADLQGAVNESLHLTSLDYLNSPELSSETLNILDQVEPAKYDESETLCMEESPINLDTEADQPSVWLNEFTDSITSIVSSSNSNSVPTIPSDYVHPTLSENNLHSNSVPVTSIKENKEHEAVEPLWEFMSLLREGNLYVNMLREIFSTIDEATASDEEELIDMTITVINHKLADCDVYAAIEQSLEDEKFCKHDNGYLSVWKPYFTFINSPRFRSIWLKTAQSRFQSSINSVLDRRLDQLFLWSGSSTYQRMRSSTIYTYNDRHSLCESTSSDRKNISSSSNKTGQLLDTLAESNDSSQIQSEGLKQSVTSAKLMTKRKTTKNKLIRTLSERLIRNSVSVHDVSTFREAESHRTSPQSIMTKNKFDSSTANNVGAISSSRLSDARSASRVAYKHTAIDIDSGTVKNLGSMPSKLNRIAKKAFGSSNRETLNNKPVRVMSPRGSLSYNRAFTLIGSNSYNSLAIDDDDEIGTSINVNKNSLNVHIDGNTNNNNNNNSAELDKDAASLYREYGKDIRKGLFHLMNISVCGSSCILLAAVMESLFVVLEACSTGPLVDSILTCISSLWIRLNNTTLQKKAFHWLCQLASTEITNSNKQINIITYLLKMMQQCSNRVLRVTCVRLLCLLSTNVYPGSHAQVSSTLPYHMLLNILNERIKICEQVIVTENRPLSTGNKQWVRSTSMSSKKSKHWQVRLPRSITNCLQASQIYQVPYSGNVTRPANTRTPPIVVVEDFDTGQDRDPSTGSSNSPNLPIISPSAQSSDLHSVQSPTSFHFSHSPQFDNSSFLLEKFPVKTVTGDLTLGLVPAPLPTPAAAATAKKKEPPQRKGEVIDARTPVYSDHMVKVPIEDSDLNPTQVDDHEDDVDLSKYMDIEDDMECKSAASWNEKYTFPTSEGTKHSPDQSKISSASTQGRRVTSALNDKNAEQASGLGSADSRIRVSVTQRTSLWSERMSDIDAMSIQMDAYDDIVEDHLTPQPSVSESAADESTTRSGMSPMRLPNLLPDLDEVMGMPTRSDALSMWLMGSVPRAGSVADSECPTRPSTRPGTTIGELRPTSTKLSVIDSKSILKVSPFLKSRLENQIAEKGRKAKSVHVTIDDGSMSGIGTEARPNSAVTELTHSPMLGHRNKRPHTAPVPLDSSFQDLQEAFDEALLRYQGDTDYSYDRLSPVLNSTRLSTTSYQIINRLFKNNSGSYDENWQDKLIERHKLLSMQKQIRAKSAVHRREVLHQQQMDKRHSLLGHRHCDGVIDASSESTSQRSTTRGSESRMRINSASTKPLISVSLSNARATSAKVKNNKDVVAASPLLEKANVTNETQVQYRFRINESLCEKIHSAVKSYTPVQSEREPDSVTYDPRRPDSVRRPGSRSIPSKCTRFVLVKQKKSGNRPGSPTPLEKQLLVKRFPSYASRVIPKYIQQSLAAEKQKIQENKNVPIPTQAS